MGSAEGQWFLARLGSTNFLYSPTFTGNSTTFHNEGRRAVALSLYDRIRASDPENNLRLLQAEAMRFKYCEELAERVKSDG